MLYSISVTDTTLETQVQDIKNQIAQAQREQIRAEHVHDSAKAAADGVKLRLQDEFGVETIDEASGKLKELEKKLRESINNVRKSLGEVG